MKFNLNEAPDLHLLLPTLFLWQVYNSGLKYMGGRRTVAIDFQYEETNAFPSVSLCPIVKDKPKKNEMFNFTLLREQSFRNLDFVKEAFQFSNGG